MAQVKRQTTQATPTPRRVPPVLDTPRPRIPLRRTSRQTQSFRVEQESPNSKSPVRAVHPKPVVTHASPPFPPPPPPLPPPPPQSRLKRVAQPKSDVVPVPNIDLTTIHKPDTAQPESTHELSNDTVLATTTTSHENYEKSYILSSTINPLLYREAPIIQTVEETNNSSQHHQQQEQSQLQSQPQQEQQHHHDQMQLQKINNHKTEESVVIPTTSNNDGGLPIVSIDGNRVPVYARFPFDVSFLPQPMDTNVEDNIHKLRLRLIDAELNHQRRSTDDYIKRTQDQIPLSNSKPTEYYLNNITSTNNALYPGIKRNFSNLQASNSQLSIRTPVPVGNLAILSRDRVGMPNDGTDHSDIERDLQIRRIEESISNGRRSNQQLMISNYAYDPRLHLQPMNSLIGERQYTSSNMDDLIDSMARRHLAHRRLDVAIDRQRRGTGGSGSPTYFGSPALRRQSSLMSQHRDDDLYRATLMSGSHGPQDVIRLNNYGIPQVFQPRMDYYNRIPPDIDELTSNNIVRTNSYSRLPPISPSVDTNRFNRTQNPSNSALFQVKYGNQESRNIQRPLGPPDNAEHLIELPSDIFLSSRAEQFGSSQRHHQSRRIMTEIVPKEKSASVDSEMDQSDVENIMPIVNHQLKQNTAKKSENGHDGFFTESHSTEPQPQPQQQFKLKQEPKKATFYQQPFKKAALGIVFINTLKRRAARSRLNRPSQTLSATIHKIRLQEIMVALHRVYLEPDGPIYNALIQAVSNQIELKEALNHQSKHYLGAINLIGQVLKNVISKIVDFMPRDGILGTSKTSAIAALIQDGNPFPENYFWQCEKEILEFSKSKIINVTKQRAILLLIGVFIFRGLVTTLLIKPIKYRFLLGELTLNQAASLKVLASVILYVGRRAAKSMPQILALPHEWESSLYSDADIEPITQHAEIKSIITTCELSLRVWCEEYIRRIDTSFGKELRT